MSSKWLLLRTGAIAGFEKGPASRRRHDGLLLRGCGTEQIPNIAGLRGGANAKREGKSWAPPCLQPLRVFRHPPQRPVPAATRPWEALCADAHPCGNQTSLRAPPWRGARGCPAVFRALACADLRFARPFLSALLRSKDGRYPSPCALPPRRSPRGRSAYACRVLRGNAKAKADKEKPS